jgi:pimeloyl-ACP methyl ester carboxylesterase
VSDAPGWFVEALGVSPSVGHVLVDGCTINVLTWGEPGRPLLVLVHGGAAHARWWSFLAPLLARDRRVVALDLSGHGDSGWRDAYRVEQWSDEVRAVTEVAQAEATRAGGPRSATSRRPIVLGHSLGAQVSCVVAARHGDHYAGAVLADFGIRRPGEQSRSGRHFQNQRVYPTYDEAVKRFKLVPRQACDNPWALRHIAESSVRRTDRGWAWKFDWRVFTRTSDRLTSEYLGDIRIPTAFLHGQESRVVTIEVAQRVSAAFGRPAPVVWVPEARHHLMLDQPLAFVAATRALLSHLDLASGAPGVVAAQPS